MLILRTARCCRSNLRRFPQIQKGPAMTTGDHLLRRHSQRPRRARARPRARRGRRRAHARLRAPHHPGPALPRGARGARGAGAARARRALARRPRRRAPRRRQRLDRRGPGDGWPSTSRPTSSCSARTTARPPATSRRSARPRPCSTADRPRLRSPRPTSAPSTTSRIARVGVLAGAGDDSALTTAADAGRTSRCSGRRPRETPCDLLDRRLASRGPGRPGDDHRTGRRTRSRTPTSLCSCVARGVALTFQDPLVTA